MQHTKLEKKMLLSRFLTRSGDQAWDFAVPLTLVSAMPTRLDLVAFIYLITKLGSVVLQPWAAGLIDSAPRLRTAITGISIQVAGLIVVALMIFSSDQIFKGFSGPLTPKHVTFLAVVAFGNIASSLGAGMMDIAVGNDWVPTLLTPSRLTAFNSRLRQLDLATEVGAPVVAGILLAFTSLSFPLLGFYIVAAWNVVSFLPEMLLLRSVFAHAPQLQRVIVLQKGANKNLFAKFFEGWGEFRKQKCMPVMLAYAFLWLSALSPHGILLTAFLKGGWHLPQSMLGLFRGLGAVFGLVSTLLFPWIVKKMGLLNSTRIFIVFQAAMVLLALLSFLYPIANGLPFLGFILLSRIGLYGFSLGEIEIRQRMIPEGVRGVVNGAANSLTGFATVLLFALGSYFSTPNRFSILVWVSVGSVFLGSVVYSFWVAKQNEWEGTT